MREFQQVVRACLLILAVGGSMPAGAQTFQGSFSGTVTDPSGAVIPGSTVTALDLDRGFSRSAVTLDDGTYQIALLPPGRYRLEARKSGFETLVMGAVNLSVNQHLKQDFRMKLGAQTSMLVVKAEAEVVETQSSSMGTTLGETNVEQAPLNGRHFLELAVLLPGVVPGTAGSRVSDRGGAINVNGLRDSMNSYWLDGLDDTAIGVGQFAVVPPLGSVLEFRMETGDYEAKFGAHAGGQVNIVTRSGSNKLHGSVHEFLLNSGLDARNFFDPSVPPFHRNQFGGELGGPLSVPGLYSGRDRTFYFIGYEGLRERRSFFNRALVPTLAERGGDFTDLFSPSCPKPTLLINPLSLLQGQPMPFTNINQVLPAADPVGQAMVNLYPEPNIPGAACGSVNYVARVGRRVDQDNFFGRLDKRLESNDSLFLRYNLNLDRQFLPPDTSSRAAQTHVPGYGTSTRDGFQMAGLDWTHIFTHNLINELKLGYSRWQIRDNIEGAGNPFASQNGIQGLTFSGPREVGVPNLNFAGFDSLGADNTDPQGGAVNTFQVADTVTHVIGNHSLAYGADLRSVERGNFVIDSIVRGEFDFTGAITGCPPVSPQLQTACGQVQAGLAGQLGLSPNAVVFGNSVADALLGLPTFWINGFQQNLSGHLGEYDFFGQDLWKVRSNLTLNFGLRYEFKGLSTEKLDRFGNFDFNRGLLMVAGRNSVTLENFDPTTMVFVPVGTTSLGSTGANRSLQLPDKDDFAPRFGFAWQPFEDSNTVVRGGYGIFYNQTFGDVFFEKSANPPFVRITAGNIGGALPFIQSGALPLGSGAIIQTALAGIAGPAFPAISPFQLDFQDALIHEWSLDVQHEWLGTWLVDFGYVGTRGLRLPRETDPNQPVPDPLTATAPMPFPQLSRFSYTESSGRSIYHALQLKLERHYTRGLAFLGAYTYSKSIDTNSNEFTTSRDANFPQDSRNLAAEKAVSDFDFRHRLTLAYVYDLPVGSKMWKLENPRLNYLIAGWQLSGIFMAESGPHFTPQISGNVSGADEEAITGSGNPTDRPNVTGAAFYPAHKTPDQYVNPSAFATPAAFTFGNAGRNILRGPGLSSWDFSLIRRFRLTETKNLEFRTEMFNVLNHPNFDIPERDLASPSFGKIFNTLRPVAGIVSGGPGEPREVQFALKLNW